MRWWFFGMLVACAPVALPHVPMVSSDTGRACVHECQALYNACMAGGQWLGDGPIASGAQGRVRNAINACRENLGGCYATCPA